MQRETKSNREKIIEAAIMLYSNRSFSSVSQREIAAAVGIKAASIYNHFPSKDAILEEIVDLFRLGLKTQYFPAFDSENTVNLPAYLGQIALANDAFFQDPANLRLGLVIMREQFSNAAVRGMLYDMMIVGPRERISAAFSRLMEQGKMRRGDPLFAAKEYLSYFVYEFYENALSAGLSKQNGEALQQSKAHMDRFLVNWAL